MSTSTSWMAAVPVDSDRSESGRSQDVELLFDRCSAALYRYIALRVGRDRPLTDDLMQQLWLHAAKSKRIIPPDEFEYWLRGIARNLVNDHWRKIKRRPAHIPFENPMVATELAGRIDRDLLPWEILEKKEVKDQLMLALTELPAEEQDMIILHYCDGQSYKQIGDKLQLSERAVEGRLYRARQKLKENLAHLDEAGVS